MQQCLVLSAAVYTYELFVQQFTHMNSGFFLILWVVSCMLVLFAASSILYLYRRASSIWLLRSWHAKKQGEAGAIPETPAASKHPDEQPADIP